MTFDTTIPIWPLISSLVGILSIPAYGIYQMWLKQRDHTKQLDKLHDDQEEIRELVIDKNEKTFAEIKKLENAFSLQKESLIEIKTLLKLILDNKIKS